MKRELFKAAFGTAVLIGDVVHTDARPRWLFLHGAGRSDRKGFEWLRTRLADEGVASCSFDFIGHGETGGSLIGSSLQSRVAQAEAVIDAQAMPPLSIVASSMGGYIAIKLTELYDVENLVLVAPAVYAEKAYSAPFGPVFTEMIRNPFSWRETDAWRILGNFKGNLLILEAERDQVIPHEVIEGIYDSAGKARSREIVTVRDATHSLAKWLDEHPEHREDLIKKVCGLEGEGKGSTFTAEFPVA